MRLLILASSRAVEPCIDDGDLSKALTQISPSALRGVNLVKDSDGPDWDDVGGLSDIKEILIQMLQWPTMVKFLTKTINFLFIYEIQNKYRYIFL